MLPFRDDWITGRDGWGPVDGAGREPRSNFLSVWHGDRLFDIVKVERWEHPSGKRIEVAWSVRAGQWAYYWLNAQGRVYLARMAKALLELDHQGVALTKKLGQRIVLLANAVSGLRSLRIGGLLEDVGELPAPQERGHHWAGRTRDRFEHAMLELEQAGIFNRVLWPKGYGPGDSRNRKGWGEDWLSAQIQVTLPELHRVAGDIPSVVEETDAPSASFDNTSIQRARYQVGWKQEQLATHLGISRKHLSLIENGKVMPSEQLLDKISGWIAEVPLLSQLGSA